jgi:ABC-type multidrug transport system fused ATPase/permease subunit
MIRLACFLAAIASGYYFFDVTNFYFLLLSIALLSTFLYLIRHYDKLKAQSELKTALAQINRREIDLMKDLASLYEAGEEFIDTHHAYSYDIDLFGQGSLYQFLNRCSTGFGRNTLARALLQPDTNAIEKRQEAIRELSGMLHFRQHLQAAGSIHSTEEKKIGKLKYWLQQKPAFPNKNFYYFLLIFPLVTILSWIVFFVTDIDLYQSLAGLFFVLNLAITFSFGKKMMQQIAVSTDINKTLQQFSDQLVYIENQSFQSPLLKELQASVKKGTEASSRSIAVLASRFHYLDYLYNVFVSPLLNGFFLFHIHILYSLDRWKHRHGIHLMQWLGLIGEMEALSSFANFHFNNPGNCFPALSKEEDVSARNLGHPLISPKRRVSNDISFRERKFVVLTGSNMSGKSTFLRTLGVNMVLARAGSAVCASKFVFYPYDVFVSMRISDSLQDSESLFYAELKRLQSIIRHLSSGNKTFIILDEILRGTNSNDKHNGTVGLIRQLIQKKACGIIATHDLSVADLEKEYPGAIAALCFESEIVGDELLFDYKIKNGVCTKLSASFLMKKMGIIEE